MLDESSQLIGYADRLRTSTLRFIAAVHSYVDHLHHQGDADREEKETLAEAMRMSLRDLDILILDLDDLFYGDRKE